MCCRSQCPQSDGRGGLVTYERSPEHDETCRNTAPQRTTAVGRHVVTSLSTSLSFNKLRTILYMCMVRLGQLTGMDDRKGITFQKLQEITELLLVDTIFSLVQMKMFPKYAFYLGGLTLSFMTFIHSDLGVADSAFSAP